MKENKIFLICTERSGSNFITKLMNKHSQVCGPSPKHIMNPVYRNIFRYGDLQNSNNWRELIKDILNLYNVKFSSWKSTFRVEELEENVEKGNYAKLLNYIFEKETRLNGKEITFIKELKIYEFIYSLTYYYPNVKYIYLVRDPRDVALSWKKSTSHNGGVINASYQWKLDQQNALKNNYILKMQNQVLTVKYEDLISNTENKLKEITQFVELEYEPQMLEYYKDTLTQENATMLKNWENLSKDVIQDNYNKFLKELTNEEIKYIEKICINEMNALQYESINSPQELENISSEEVKKFQQIENTNKPYKPSQSIIENMKAKKVFYEKNLS